MHSISILKFGSTVWDNVGLIFSDSTLEVARMHSVGVMAQEERIAVDGTLHLLSISKRRKGTKPTYRDLTDIFHREPLEPLEYEVRETEDEEYEEVVIDSVEGGSITAAIFGIVKGTVGPAVLYLPRGFAMSGYAVAIPSMIIATTTYLYSATRLLQCWKVESDKMKLFSQKLEEIRELLDPIPQENIEPSYGYGSISPRRNDQRSIQNPKTLLTYPELSRRAFGKASVLISGGIVAMQFGVCLTYLIFVPQNLYESTKSLFGLEIPRHFFLLGMLFIEIPLVWIRDIRKLTPMNILATMLIAFGLASVLFIALFGSSDFSAFHNDTKDSSNVNGLSQLVEDIIHLPATDPTWFLFIGTSFFCFEGAITLIVPLQEAVYKKQDRERFPNINRRVTASIVTFYIFFAIICW
jgi:Amino acid permeases